MPITEVACCTAKCDDCGDGWQDGDFDGMPHFKDRTEALMYLIGLPPTGDGDTDEDANEDNWGWTLTEPDGAEILLCKTCTATRFCTAQGHDWGEWRTCMCGGTSDRHDNGTTSRWRHCQRPNCCAAENVDEPGECEARYAPLPQSRGALLVTQRRHFVLYESVRLQRPELADVSDEPHEVPSAVAGLVAEAAEIVGRIDDLLPAEYVVP